MPRAHDGASAARRAAVFVLAGVAALAASIRWDSACAEENEIVLAPVSVTGSRLPQADRPSTQAGIVITPRDLEARAPPGLPELLRSYPSLYVDQPGAPGGFASLYLRGADPNHTIVLVDGVRINDPTDTRGGGADLSLLDIADVERIEVLPGALSAIHGGDAMAGVVSITTRRPVADAWRFAAGGGGHGFGIARAAYERVTTPLAYRAGASWIEDGAGSDAFRRVTTGRVTAYAGDRAGLHAEVTLHHQRTRTGSFPEDSGGPRYALRRTLEQRDVTGTIASAALGAALHGATVRLYANTFEQDADVASPGVAPGPRDPAGLPASTWSSNFRRVEAGATATLGTPDAIAGVIGIERRHEHGTVESLLRFGPASVPANFALTRDTDSLFGEVRWSPLERVVAHGGARLDRVDGFGSRWNGQLGVSYRLAARTIAAANAGTGFKPPSFFALAHPLVGNPDLAPEQSRTGEVVLASERAEGVPGWRAVAFAARYRNLVDFDAGPPPRLVNRGRVDIRGVSGEVELAPIPALETAAGVTTLWFDLPEGVPALRNRPRTRATGRLTWAARADTSVALFAGWTGSRVDSSIPTGTVSLPSFFAVDGTLQHVRGNLRATLAVDNMLDRRHDELVGFPALGRRVRVELELRL